MRIGLIGKNGAGKSTVCNLLNEQGFIVISLSDFVRQHARKQALSPNRDTLIQIGTALKQEFGPDILAKWAVEHAQETSADRVVFDSIRLPEEVNYLKSKGVCFIGIDAPLEVRFERVSQRKKDTDAVDFDTFKQQDEDEYVGKHAGQCIKGAFEKVDHVVENAGDIAALKKQVTDALMVIKNNEEL